MLVVEVDEVLDRVDIAQRDRPGRIEPLPVVEGVAVVTEDRRPPQTRANVAERHGEVARQDRGRLLPDLVDVGRRQEAEPHVVQPQLRQRDGSPAGNGGSFKLRARARKPLSCSRLGKSRPSESSAANSDPGGELDQRIVLGQEAALQHRGAIMRLYLSLSLKTAYPLFIEFYDCRRDGPQTNEIRQSRVERIAHCREVARQCAMNLTSHDESSLADRSELKKSRVALPTVSPSRRQRHLHRLFPAYSPRSCCSLVRRPLFRGLFPFPEVLDSIASSYQMTAQGHPQLGAMLERGLVYDRLLIESEAGRIFGDSQAERLRLSRAGFRHRSAARPAADPADRRQRDRGDGCVRFRPRSHASAGAAAGPRWRPRPR